MYKDNFLILFITLFCFLFTYLFFGFYYVEYEGLTSALFSGTLTPNLPFRSMYFSGNFGVSYLYSYLYETFPNIECLSWIYYSYLFVSSFLACYIVNSLLPEKTSIYVKITLYINVYIFVFSDHAIHLLYTRVSYMVCGLSLISLIVIFHSSDTIKSRLGIFILINIFFLLGALSRIESAVACFLLIIFFALAFSQNNVKQIIRLFFFPCLIIAAISLRLTFDISTATSKEFYKQVEPDIEEQLIARENKIELSEINNHRDSIIYSAASDMMWSDPKIISPQYLRSLIQSEKFIFTDVKQWKRVYKNCLEISLKYWYLIAFTSLLSLILFFIIDVRKNKLYPIYLIGFVLSFWILIVIQTYTDKLNDRSFSPYLSLFIFCHFLMLMKYYSSKKTLWLYPVSFFCFIFLAFHLWSLKIEATILKKDLMIYQSNFEKIKKVAGNSFLVINSTSFDYLFLSNKPFHPFNFSIFKKIYITDGYIIPFLPYYKRYLEGECNCDIYNFPSFWYYLESVHEKVVIVSAPLRMKIIQEYIFEMYHHKLPVKEKKTERLNNVQKSDTRGYEEELSVYTLE